MKDKQEILHEMADIQRLLVARVQRANRIVSAPDFDHEDAKNEMCTEIMLMEQMLEKLIEFYGDGA